MVKQFLILIVLSVVVIILKNSLAQVLHGLVWLHQQIGNWLSVIFSQGYTGQIIKDVLALILLPLLFGLVVALVLWSFKRSAASQAMLVIWVVWIVLTVAILQ